MRKFLFYLVVALFTIPMAASAVVPSISINSNLGISVCAGANVIFSSNITNGGTTPTYQWKINGVNVGTNSSTFSTTTLANDDTVYCVLTSNDPGASPTTVTSNKILMVVSPVVTPTLSLSTSTGLTTICAGDTMHFTATNTNGGGGPTYQWKVNGANAGINSKYFNTNTLSNNDVVYCEMTSNKACASPVVVNSDTMTITVNPIVAPSVTIASGSGTSICAGQSVNFTATPVNGGSSPSFQWKKNGANVGVNSNIYSTSSLSNGDVITCVLTSNAQCISTTTANSNSIAMTVNPVLTPSVTIASNKGTSICVNDTVTFTPTPVNGGTTPVYQWKVNGTIMAVGATYTTNTINNGDIVSVKMTSNATCVSPDTVNSAGLTMATTGATASVSIASNKGSSVCGGDTVTFTATPVNGGTTPSYQWKVNGANAGANSSTFTTSSLSNGDVVSCVLTSSSACVVNGPANSNSIAMTVTAKLTPVVAITLTPNDTICAGTQVTFTANSTNGGGTPAYQWKVNGSNVGSNSATFITNTLANGDVVTCVLTSSIVCVTSATATSNAITMTVNPILTPVITISVSPDDTICAGASTTFSATTANGGLTPSYQWKKNGANVGTNSNSYNTSTLANGDAVWCILTTSEACISKSKDTSNTINMTVKANLTPSVSITVSPKDTICAGTPVTFTATPVNGGTTPSYQWKVNGTNVGSNSPTFNVGGLNNNDVVVCVMTSSEPCVTTSLAASNSIKMTVFPNITPDVTLGVAPNDTICAGTMTTFTANPVNGGTSPTYQWQLNGVNAGTGNTYSSTTFSTGDVIRCIMTSNGVCLTKPKDTSDPVTMTVMPNLTPAIVITHFPTDTICDGTNVTFTATSANGGLTPTYQWQVNGANVGLNNLTYSSTTLANGDKVRCYMTSSSMCLTKPTDTSNVITIGVKSKVTPDVTITASPNDTICQGTSVTFTAVATNASNTPSYQWQVNGSDVGTNSNTYMNGSLADGDMIRCIVTTGDTCVTKSKDTSNVITMNVRPIVTPDVTTTVAPNDTICVGTNTTFTATPVNGGTTPSYQWRVNGTNAGANSATFSTTTLANNDVVDVIMTSSELCVTKSKDTSAGITMNVKPILTPDVTIIVLPNDTICDGTNVTFIATPVNEGTTPTYQWQVNGSNVGTNNASFSSTTLANNDVVRVIMTSSEMCLSKAADTSNEITMTVNPNLVADVTITVSPDDTICVGTNTTFTATPVNGGTTPTYQWKVNGTNAGTNSATFATTSLANNDVVTVVMTSNETCLAKAADTSNGITMTVKPYLTPVVTIVESPNDTICTGTNVTFTATPTDGGTTPTYQWQINGSNVGTNSTTFSSSTLANNDAVRVIMTSSEMCLTKPDDTSNVVTMTVNAIVTPDVTIAVSPDDTVCAGTLVSFLATPTNEGTAPTYQWKLNGSNVGINANGYSSNSLANGDVVTCVLTSSLMCVTKSMDTSNAIAMTVNPLTTPGVVVLANTGVTACVNGEVTFTATPFNSGTSQSYQWRLNGADISGANSISYITNSLASGDKISCRMDITAVCPAPDSAISNTLTMNIVTPSASISVSPNDTICDNQSAIFSVAGVNVGNSPVYQWSLNGVDQTGVTGNIFTMNTVGHQDVITTRFVSSDNCINAPSIASTNSITMTVNPTAPPTAGIAANPGTVLTNSDIVWFTSSVNTPNATYQWRKNGVDIPGATGIVYTDLDPQDGDTISLFITTTDSCRTPDTALSNIVVLSVGVGVPEVKQAELFEDVVIAPNPNNGTFILKGTLSQGRTDEHVYVEVINAVGALIYKEDVPVRNHELNTRIELGDRASNGLHMVRITAEGRVHLLKFISNK
ncbi:MAG: hypothetical protein H6550_04260 [Chitinophagales bacterium]|nr:hypothetical protein [Chitinophagales bacterium]